MAIEIIKSCGNVFKDLELPNPEELFADSSKKIIEESFGRQSKLLRSVFQRCKHQKLSAALAINMIESAKNLAILSIYDENQKPGND